MGTEANTVIFLLYEEKWNDDNSNAVNKHLRPCLTAGPLEITIHRSLVSGTGLWPIGGELYINLVDAQLGVVSLMDLIVPFFRCKAKSLEKTVGILYRAIELYPLVCFADVVVSFGYGSCRLVYDDGNTLLVSDLSV